MQRPGFSCRRPGPGVSRRVPMQDRQNSFEVDFGVWASIVLIGLAIVSVALGVAPVVDPTIFPAP
jgi:hypothetical protein